MASRQRARDRKRARERQRARHTQRPAGQRQGRRDNRRNNQRGRGRGAQQRTKRLVAAVVAVLLAIGAATMVLASNDDDRDPGARPSASASASATPSGSPSPGEAGPPDVVPGAAVPAGTAASFYLVGPEILRYDVATGESRRVRPAATSEGALPRFLAPVDGGVALVAGASGPFPPADGPAQVIREGRTYTVGFAGSVVADPSRQSVWLVRWNDGGASGDVRRATLRGEPGGERMEFKGKLEFWSRTADGFVVTRLDQRGPEPTVAVWLPATGTFRDLRLSGDVLAADDRRVVSKLCPVPATCVVEWRDTTTARGGEVRMPAGFKPYQGAISGTRLVLAGEGPRKGTTSLLSVDLASGATETIPLYDGLAGTSLAWTGDGQWLGLSIETTRGRTLALWRPGQRQASIAKAGFDPSLVTLVGG